MKKAIPFKILAVICLLIFITLSIAYYFVIFLPQNKNEQLLLSKQKFEYQKEKDTTARKDEQLKELQNSIKANEKETQDNWNRARAECVAIADKNYQSFKEALDGCQTTECQVNLINNKDIQYFGGTFIDSCTQKNYEKLV